MTFLSQWRVALDYLTPNYTELWRRAWTVYRCNRSLTTSNNVQLKFHPKKCKTMRIVDKHPTYNYNMTSQDGTLVAGGSSGKYDVVIRYFQTAAFSVGFNLDTIEHKRSSRYKHFNNKSQWSRSNVIFPRHSQASSNAVSRSTFLSFTAALYLDLVLPSFGAPAPYLLSLSTWRLLLTLRLHA